MSPPLRLVLHPLLRSSIRALPRRCSSRLRLHPSLVFSSVRCFTPEFATYLDAQTRHEELRKAIKQYHRSGKHPDSIPWAAVWAAARVESSGKIPQKPNTSGSTSSVLASETDAGLLKAAIERATEEERIAYEAWLEVRKSWTLQERVFWRGHRTRQGVKTLLFMVKVVGISLLCCAALLPLTWLMVMGFDR